MSNNRKLYKSRKDAAKFLKKHPELAGKDLEHSDKFYHKDQKELYEPNTIRAAKAEFIMEGLHFFPDGQVKRALSMYYFEGASISTIQKALKKKTKNATCIFISRAKKTVYEWYRAYINRKVEFSTSDVQETKTIKMGDGAVKLYLVFDDYTEELVWVTEEGRALPPELQDYVEGEWIEWDIMFY